MSVGNHAWWFSLSPRLEFKLDNKTDNKTGIGVRYILTRGSVTFSLYLSVFSTLDIEP